LQKAILTDIALSQGVAFSEWAYVLSLQAFGALRQVELHGLTLLKALETSRLDCREMHKNVSATLTANEAVALGVIEPLYCSLFCHVNTGSFQSIYAGEIRRYGRQIISLLGEELLMTDSV
jgi:hypothetical protein